ncbi:MAG: hypothetical protein PF694_08165 [Bacteroidetes bacterium]|jgi:hypothetical protein|nr:hypothetical protein [Bacteroidota bacterium]
MKAASISAIKAELYAIPAKEVVNICLKLAKFKKENKEMLSYLLFQAQDDQAFVQLVKDQIDEEFNSLNKSQIYLAKKTIRKALRTTNKNIKFASSKQLEVELRLYFCTKLQATGLALTKHQVLYNLYQRQILLVDKALQGLHEDLQHDYKTELSALRLN